MDAYFWRDFGAGVLMEEIKKSLKLWERNFYKINSRKPTKSDVASSSEDIQDLYRQYSALKRANEDNASVFGHHLNKKSVPDKEVRERPCKKSIWNLPPKEVSRSLPKGKDSPCMVTGQYRKNLSLKKINSSWLPPPPAKDTSPLVVPHGYGSWGGPRRKWKGPISSVWLEHCKPDMGEMTSEEKEEKWNDDIGEEKREIKGAGKEEESRETEEMTEGRETERMTAEEKETEGMVGEEKKKREEMKVMAGGGINEDFRGSLGVSTYKEKENFVRLNMRTKRYTRRPGRTLSGSAYKRYKWKNRQKASGCGREGFVCFKCGKSGHWARNCKDGKKGSTNLGVFSGQSVEFSESMALDLEENGDLNELNELCPFPTIKEAARMALGLNTGEPEDSDDDNETIPSLLPRPSHTSPLPSTPVKPFLEGHRITC